MEANTAAAMEATPANITTAAKPMPIRWKLRLRRSLLLYMAKLERLLWRAKLHDQQRAVVVLIDRLSDLRPSATMARQFPR